MKPLAAFIFALLILAQFSFAAEEGVNMQTFCRNLLGLPQEQTGGAANNSSASSGSASSFNFTYSSQYYSALAGLQEANQSVQNMKNAGLPYAQSQDLYTSALQSFYGQAALETQKEKADYGFALSNTAQIKNIALQATGVSDELKALDTRLAGVAPEINITAANADAAAAHKEFTDGRFAEAKPLINSAYDKAVQAEAEATRSKALLESTRRTLEVFLQDNWQTIAAVVAAAAIIFFIFQKQIRRFTINAKISALTAERGVLEGMIKGLQKDYFEDGKINELSFHIKTKKYGDLIRNINRQLPLLKEELKKL
ncbi:MAG: hypothetical protein NTV88_00425 [Candidatus Micrarchaeota archaeon]|nr:hypothetical protein [Candidatus Micrarchaeota archaeon]